MVLDRLRWSTKRKSSSLHSLCSLPTWSSWAELLRILAATSTIDALIQPEPIPLPLKINLGLDLDLDLASTDCAHFIVIGPGRQALAFRRDWSLYNNLLTRLLYSVSLSLSFSFKLVDVTTAVFINDYFFHVADRMFTFTVMASLYTNRNIIVTSRRGRKWLANYCFWCSS